MKYFLMTVLLATLVNIGCDKGTSPPPKKDASSSADKAAADKAAADKAAADKAAADKAAADKAAADKAAADKAAADKAAADKAAADKAAADKATADKAAADKAAADKAAADKAAADKAAADKAAEAQSLLAKVLEYVKDKKLDLAEESLKKLETQKSSLPADMQTKVSSARTALDAAKAADKIKLPGV